MEDKSDGGLACYVTTKTRSALRFTKDFVFLHVLLTFVVILLYLPSFAQKDSARIIVNAEIMDKDTLPVMVLNPFEVIEKPDPNAIKKLNEVNRLYVNVNKVLPYARVAKAT